MTFTALPAGWYNYFEQFDDRDRRRVYRNPCPGILEVPTETDPEFKPGELQGGKIIEAAFVAGYLGTFYGEEFWQEFGTTAPNETPTAS